MMEKGARGIDLYFVIGSDFLINPVGIDGVALYTTGNL